MKLGNVVLGGAILGTLLLSGQAMAQSRPPLTEDDFLGSFDPSIPWIWTIPGNTPNDTEDPTHYSFSANSLDILPQSGSLYSMYNNALNIPTLVVLDQPAIWYVQTAIATDWSQASLDAYVHAGLLFLVDADNYFTIYYSRDVPNAPKVQITSTYEAGANPIYGNVASGNWDPTTNYVEIRVEGTPDHITFMFNHTGTWEVAGTFSSTNFPDEFAFLSSLVGYQVGLVTDTGGGFNNAPFSFNYFKTNLVVR
jgi:hypothetical protein